MSHEHLIFFLRPWILNLLCDPYLYLHELWSFQILVYCRSGISSTLKWPVHLAIKCYTYLRFPVIFSTAKSKVFLKQSVKAPQVRRKGTTFYEKHMDTWILWMYMNSRDSEIIMNLRVMNQLVNQMTSSWYHVMLPRTLCTQLIVAKKRDSALK